MLDVQPGHGLHGPKSSWQPSSRKRTFCLARPIVSRKRGLPTALIESLVCKYLSIVGSSSGRGIAEEIGLPFGILEGVFHSLRNRQILVYSASAPFNDHIYGLTEDGRQRTQSLMACLRVRGARARAAGRLRDVGRGADRSAPRRPRRTAWNRRLPIFPSIRACSTVLGPAVNSGAGLFLYGSPGNGKSTLARRMTGCFGQQIWIPARADRRMGRSSSCSTRPITRRSRRLARPHACSGRLRPALGEDPPARRSWSAAR